MKTVKQFENHLRERLQLLEEKLHEIDDELISHNSRDSEELAVERETDEVLEGLGLSGQLEIRAIQAALARIDAGEFGSCVKCGTQISEERLEVLPHAPLCKDCVKAID